MIISKIDGKVCSSMLGLSIHLKKYNMTVLDYYIKYENLTIPKCPICGKDRKHHKSNLFRETCGDKKCITSMTMNSPNFSKNSEEVKDKIRKARIDYMKNNGGQKTAWKNRSEGRMSKGENIIHNIFTENKIYEKYTVVNEFCEYPYFIDFAFINEKIAVEYDGKCHFEYGDKRIEHDFKKDKYLKSMGWRIYRIPFFDLKNFKIENLIEFIGTPTKIESYNILIMYRDYLDKLKSRKKNNYLNLKESKRKVERPPYEQLLEEINELGYRGTGRKYSVSDNAIRKWVKNYKKYGTLA